MSPKRIVTIVTYFPVRATVTLDSDGDPVDDALNRRGIVAEDVEPDGNLNGWRQVVNDNDLVLLDTEREGKWELVTRKVRK